MSGLEFWLLRIGGDVRADIVAPIGFVLAALVSAHVLLHKRDVGSSIGWIGLAWLSPILGSAIYFMFGINRVTRRAQRVRMRSSRGERPTSPPDGEIAETFESLECAARRITNRTAEDGNTIEMLQNGDEAYPVMLAAIAEAKSSVLLSSYIFRNDAGGAPFVEALIAAKQRGVEVRVLIDGIGAGYFYSGVYRRLHRAGVPVARFMHSTVPWRMPFLNLRTHKKILVVDGRRGFTGGMNIGAEDLVKQNPPHPVRDIQFAINGPVVAQLVEAFARDWKFATDQDLDGDIWYPQLDDVGPATARVITSGPDEDLEKIEMVILEALACARRSIRMMTPYFLPDERLVTALSLAAMRGVDVDVIVPEVSDHRIIDWAMRAHVGPLLDAGVRIWKNPPPFEHTKILVLDGCWCLIGSANWDSRSLRLNFELCVEVYHGDLADMLERFMHPKKRSRLTSATLTERSLPLRLRDAGMRLCLPYL